MLLRFHRFGLHRLNAFDFSAHKGAIAFVKVRDLQHSGVAKFACRISEKQVSRVPSAFEIEIHCQKREVVGDVYETEAVVKLDAIEDGGRLRSEMDVIEVQIAVAIKNPVVFNPLAQ